MDGIVPMQVGGWNLNVSRHVEVFPDWAVAEAQEFLLRQAQVFPKGETWVGRELGVHTLLARVDCVVRDGKLHIYEGEDRPAGVGVTSMLNPAFARRLAAIRSQWPKFRWVAYDKRPTDDRLWLGDGLTLTEALDCRDLLLVRSRPEDEAYHVLESRAVAPVRFEGCKQYGAELGLWTILGPDSALPTVTSVIKPWQGTRGRAIEIFVSEQEVSTFGLPRNRRLNTGDVLRRIRVEGGVVCQSYIPAMRLSPCPEYHGIYRMYFGDNPKTGAYEPLGGVWMATPGLIVHGMDTAITGPLVLEGDE